MRLPSHQILKIISSPDSTFHKLYSDIYFTKVVLLAARIRINDFREDTPEGLQ